MTLGKPRLSKNAKCRECKHALGDHKLIPDGSNRKTSCWGGDGDCGCHEFEVQVEDRVYASARALYELMDGF